ncbi:AraC family transcriptional regulator [Saprospiraceae bacterium]|nr:AraC family transcriptional regulator [Saprospiraceae bacterium]
MKKLISVPLISIDKITTLVEQRRAFNFKTCELSIYETRKEVASFPLSFDGFTITSMLKGTKQVRFSDLIDREYLPGNTIITPSYCKLNIDFPEASFEKPTQCTALTIDNSYVKKQVDEFNEMLEESRFIKSWRILDEPILIYNNEDLVNIQMKILRLSHSNDPFKEIHIKLLLKELVLCVLKMQNIMMLNKNSFHNNNNTPFAAIVNYIRQNIHSEIQIEDLLKISSMSKSSFYRAFVGELGISPYQLIISERLKIGKKLLLEEKLSVKETAYAIGFSGANYFIRLFKKYEGITPKQFVNKQLRF